MATAGAIRQAIDEQRAVVPITVVESPDGASVRPGTRMLVHGDGTGEGSLGDRELDRLAVGEARAALREGRSGVRTAPGERDRRIADQRDFGAERPEFRHEDFCNAKGHVSLGDRFAVSHHVPALFHFRPLAAEMARIYGNLHAGQRFFGCGQ